jgi:hypothetical protein
VTISSLVENYDVGTGKLMNEIVMANPPAAVPGTALATTPYAGGTGAVIHWLTGVIFNGRRVRGKTFVVPLAASADSDGTLASAVLANVQSAATALANVPSPGLTVWSKQYSTGTPPVQIGGINAPVDIAQVPDKIAILRSRRD